MFDLNGSRRRREIEIANEVVAEIVGRTSPPPPELIGQILAAACERSGVVLDVPTGSRILGYIEKELDRRQRIVDRLTASMEARA
jgi:hypothetical protein